MAEKSHLSAQKFEDSKWEMQIAYLADIFAEINSLNISMQSRDQTLVGLSEKLKAFKEKLKLWMNKIKAGKAASFPSLNGLLEDKSFSFTEVQDIIEEPITEFNNYIPENAHKYNWIRNPFNIAAEDLLDEMANIGNLQKQLTEIQNDETFCHDFKRQRES